MRFLLLLLLAPLLAGADTPAVNRAWLAGDSGPADALWKRLTDQGVEAVGAACAERGVAAGHPDGGRDRGEEALGTAHAERDDDEAGGEPEPRREARQPH